MPITVNKIKDTKTYNAAPDTTATTSLVKFAKGSTADVIITGKTATTFYVDEQLKELYLGDFRLTGYDTIALKSGQSGTDGKVSIDFIKNLGTSAVTTTNVPLLKLSATTTVTNDLTYNVSGSVLTSTVNLGTSTDVTAPNIIKDSGNGIYTSIKADYTNGELQLKYKSDPSQSADTSGWTPIGAAIPLHLDSFLASFDFIKSNVEFLTWIDSLSGDTALQAAVQAYYNSYITGSTNYPALFIVMKEAKSSGGSIVETYQVSNTPVGDLFTAYAFERLGAITVNHSAVGAGGTDTITYGLKLDSTGALRQADNVTGATDGLAIKLDSTGALRQNGGTGTTDGLSIKLDTTGGALVQTSGSANENGLALKLDETNVLTQTPASGLTVNLSSGLTVTSNKIAPVLGNGLALLDTAGTTGATTHINVKLSEINNNALTIESDGVYARGMVWEEF